MARDVANLLNSALQGETLTPRVDGEIQLRIADKETNDLLDLPIAKDPSPRLKLGDLVKPPVKDAPEEWAASALYREGGKPMLPLRFSLKGRTLDEIKRAAMKQLEPLAKEPFKIGWSD